MLKKPTFLKKILNLISRLSKKKLGRYAILHLRPINSAIIKNKNPIMVTEMVTENIFD